MVFMASLEILAASKRRWRATQDGKSELVTVSLFVVVSTSFLVRAFSPITFRSFDSSIDSASSKMTTYTNISGGERTKIVVHPDHKISKINENIYGGFTEHIGRCIYGGLYDPDNHNDQLLDKDGFRKDVIHALQELNVPVVRYPGGNFVATYHWLDGVGPRENRPRRPELAWLGEESNRFGTDEFMKWCEIVGTEPYLCLNFGTGG